MATERRLSEVRCHKFVAVALVYPSSHSSPSAFNAAFPFLKDSPFSICCKKTSKQQRNLVTLCLKQELLKYKAISVLQSALSRSITNTACMSTRIGSSSTQSWHRCLLIRLLQITSGLYCCANSIQQSTTR